jgi:hypothetical protein
MKVIPWRTNQVIVFRLGGVVAGQKEQAQVSAVLRLRREEAEGSNQDVADRADGVALDVRQQVLALAVLLPVGVDSRVEVLLRRRFPDRRRPALTGAPVNSRDLQPLVGEPFQVEPRYAVVTRTHAGIGVSRKRPLEILTGHRPRISPRTWCGSCRPDGTARVPGAGPAAPARVSGCWRYRGGLAAAGRLLPRTRRGGPPCSRTSHRIRPPRPPRLR